MDPKPKLCVETHRGGEAAALVFSSLIAGCASALDGCEVSVKTVENGYLVQRGQDEVRICNGRGGDCNVKINISVDGLFVHSTNLSGVEYGFVTEKPIDPDVFAGLFSCFLAKNRDIFRAFSEAIVFFTLGGGDFYETVRKAVKQTCLINSLLLSVEWVESNSASLGGMGLREILVGSRLSDKTVLYRFILDPHGLVGLRVEVKMDHGFFGKIPLNNNFLCLSSLNVDPTKYGYTTMRIDGYTCVFGDDVVNVLTLLLG